MSNSSKEGLKYEILIYNIVKNCKLNDKLFNTQKENELGGCKSNNDIECNFNNNIIPIEIKKYKTPDWMQLTLKYDTELNKWIGNPKNKIPDKSKKIFEELISDIKLFNNKIPPFITSNITHDEWLNIKKQTNDYNDVYIDCSNDIINKLYSAKLCYYIQISKYGLYHLGNDICNFNVSRFLCDQRLRIRTKVHTKKNKIGFCILSVTIACQPKNIKNLSISKYSLDNINRLPHNLIYIN